MSTDTEVDEYLEICDRIENLEYEIREREQQLEKLREEKESWERHFGYPHAR
jgi:hypothetical protein